MAESQEQLPEWMLRLENKRKKQHRLAHEIGAGAPCFVCGDGCPGLDLHFWRKLCRNCKCKKEEHDVKDDEGYEQFEILLGAGSRKTKKGGVLKIKVPEDVHSPVASKDGVSRGVSFDWLPPNVTEELAVEYMQQLPPSKLPISGSDGALYRRQQLEKQVPLHDLDAKHCHNLTPEEIEQLMKYLDNLKNNVVGQGCVGKMPVLSKVSSEKPIGTSHSSDAICPLPPMPSMYNSLPRPFQAAVQGNNNKDNDDDCDDLPPPPPLPTTLPPRADLKTPSEFMPDWKLPDDKLIKDIVGNLKTLGLDIEPGYGGSSLFQSSDMPSKHVTIPTNASEPITGIQMNSKVPSQVLYSEGTDRKYPQYLSAVSGTQSKFPEALNLPSNTDAKISPDPSSEVEGRGESTQTPTDAAGYIRSMLDPKYEALMGSRAPTGVIGNLPNNKLNLQTLHSAQNVAYTCPRDTANSVPLDKISKGVSKPLQKSETYANNDKSKTPEENNAQDVVTSETRHNNDSCPDKSFQDNKNKVKVGAANIHAQSVVNALPVDGVVTSNFLPHDLVHSNPVKTDALPKSAHMMQQSYGSNKSVPAAPATGCTEIAGENSSPHLDCRECGNEVQAGDIAVFAERASNAAWHPSCFICSTCKELLVDLMYFYHKENVYCGRHYAELLGIPRCFACDELIFVNSYTVAEAKAFHVKHFCCYECDDPLAGKKYILVDDQPVCLDCYESKYGKKCHSCNKKIGAGQQRVEWKHLNWHVDGNCFHCFECSKSLLGGRFVVKENQPFCSKECVHIGLPKLTKTV